VLGLSACSRERPLSGCAALAVATAGKLLPVVFLPFLLRRAARPVLAAAVFAVVLAGLYAPFAAAPSDMFRGTFEYAMRWRSNDSLFALVQSGAEAVVSTGWFDDFDSKLLKEPQRLAKLPLVALGLAVLLCSWLRHHRPHRAAFLFTVFFLAAAPTLHPWYVVLVVPFLCIYPNWGLLLFTCTVFTAYHVLPRWVSEGVWEEQPWVVVLEYVPFYAGVLWLLLQRRPQRADGD